ncbi:MAG: DUF4149 domain-containing protein [Woeseiaceae bacterium]|nr:DUF4149 domain-containing protein [Woeseiaceae bacterium]
MSISVSVLAIATAVWVGAILFQSAVVAPSVFTVLDEAAARRFLRALFPRFFRLGAACGAAMLIAALVGGLVAGWTPVTVWASAVSTATLVLSLTALSIIPATNAARDAGDAGRARFVTLHRVSVLMTVAMLFLGLVLLVMLVQVRS